MYFEIPQKEGFFFFVKYFTEKSWLCSQECEICRICEKCIYCFNAMKYNVDIEEIGAIPREKQLENDNVELITEERL